jgi:ring-1,2-phenylacetyl-CoA epoxidase subunit PaaE
MAKHFRSLSIKNIRRETPECVSIAFSIPDDLKDEFQFIQGQNISLKITIDGEEIRRSYSICSSPLDNELRVAVKKIENGKFSDYANSRLQEGMLVELLPPTGKFYSELNPANPKNYVAFVAGSGITPVFSIIKTTLAIEPNSQFTLFYSNRNRQSIIFKEQLEALKNQFMSRFSLHYLFSREKTDSAINHGRIDAAKCNELSKHLFDPKLANEIFICGPEDMINSVKEWFEQQKLEKGRIHFELFNAPGEKRLAITKAPLIDNTQEKISRITVKSDGISFDFDLAYNGESILDAALKEGADLPFACKSGVCCSCRAKLRAGSVKMDVNYALEPEELEAGFILACQSHPQSESLLVDFDGK